MRRYALYLAPPRDGALMRFANCWLGRDPDADLAVDRPAVAGLDPERLAAITAAPAHYGFHATLKAPFELAPGQSRGALEEAVQRFAADQTPFRVELTLGSLDGFLALLPARPSPPLDRLAAKCVQAFEPFRAPLTADDIARRRPERLRPRQRQNLERWGYPYVLEDFRFHMTLTDRLADPEHGRVRAILDELTAPFTAHPMQINTLALFEQKARSAPFVVAGRYPFAG
jgi:putative phosphonate metabolism protein